MEIYVTRPFLPPLDEFNEYLKEIWNNGILTNNGPLHQRLEQELADYLGVKHISLFSNGTLALLTALQTLRITGEVITTPYSFVATTHALWWNNIKPVFVDIEPETCNLNPQKIEAAITPKTTAILPVHVYGYPCNVKEIQKIADSFGLRVIYDAAHAFGVKLNEINIVEFGDLSVLSFHATKVFNTFEGGAIICHDEATKKRIDHLKNFGFENEITVVSPGINAKMNEVQAAMGLLQLKYIEDIIEKRKILSNLYKKYLKNISGIRFLEDLKGVKHNYSYFPIFVNEKQYGISRNELFEKLKKEKIFARRYFYPLISQFPIYRNFDSAEQGTLEVAEKITDQVICLPIYPDLEPYIVEKICNIIKINSKS
jgi:dTDP-4-amino-4,6-dideoxygalactose transaminase